MRLINVLRHTIVATAIGSFLPSAALALTSDNFGNFNTSKLHGGDTAFVGANVFNPEKGTSITDVTILVSDGNFVRIQPESQPIPTNYTIIDVNNKWVMPGLIDGHIHLAQSGSAFTRPDTFDATKIKAYEDDQQWLLENTENILKRYLKLGITTVYDLGGPSEYLPHYQQVASMGVLPDIYAAGTLLSPMDIPQLDINGKTFTKVANTKEALTMVDKQLALQSKMVKIVWSQETGLSTQQLYDLFKPAIDFAHKNGRLIAVHVEDLVNAKMAVKAGADILVHGVINDPVDSEFIQLMLTNNVTYMPTLSAYDHYFELFKNELQFTDFEQNHGSTEVVGSFSRLMENVAQTDQMFQILLKFVPMVDIADSELAKMTEREQSIIKQLRTMFSSNLQSVQKSNLQKMVNSGVNVAFGTDAGNPGTLHAVSLIGEIIEWQRAGVSNGDILKAMTYGNAVTLRLSERIGTIATGKHANFIVLDEDPVSNINTLEQPKMTVKRGVIATFDAQ